MVHHNVCPLCSSDRIFIALRCNDHLFSKEEFFLYGCHECNFLFTQDYPDANHIGKYYESDEYISHSNSSEGFANRIYHMARRLMLQRKKRLIRAVTCLDNGNLLDIGSGTGHFANIMRDAGWKVKGIEINPKAREFAISKFGLQIIGPGQINSLDDSSIDCITLWHVLEHFHDPFKYASDIIRLLKPGGICIVALPNNNSYDAKYYGEYWAAYDVPRHLWHFNTDSFRTFSNKAGFVVEKIRTLPLDTFYISFLSEKYRGSKLPFLAGMLKAIPYALLSVFNPNKSSSVIYVLRKS